MRINESNQNPALGIFFLCMGLLAYELLCVRILPIVVGPHMVYGVIAMAMLGISAAGTFVTVFGSIDERRLYWFCWGLSLLFIFVFATVTAYSDYINTSVWREDYNEVILQFLTAIQEKLFYQAIIIGTLLSLPYLLFGIVITSLFRDLNPSKYYKVYAADLLGAACGCVIFIAVLEIFGYQFALFLVLLLPLIASLAFGGMGKRILIVNFVLIVVVSVMCLYYPISRKLEPFPNIRSLARDYTGKKVIEDIWHRWNNYTRINLLGITENNKAKSVYALETGQGWANLHPYTPISNTEKPWNKSLSTHPIYAASLFKPLKTLVMLAGVGADMITLNELCAGNCSITGVELNKAMVQNALRQKEFHLKEFFELPNIDMVVAEGREYLECVNDKFDAILISFTGASISYYVGTSGHTTQYLYTKEAFDSLIDHLAPNGLLTVVNTNKAKQLLILRKIFKERKWKNLADCVVIFKTASTEDPLEVFSKWNSSADSNILMIKPNGFSSEELQKIKIYISENNRTLLFAKDYVHPDYKIYDLIVHHPAPDEVIKKIAHDYSVGLHIPTDDSPFILDMSPKNLIINRAFWFGERDDPNKLQWQFKRDFYLFVIDSLGFAVVIILLPLIWKKRIKISFLTFQYFLFFILVGTGFMLVEVGLVQKLGLLLGNPGYAIAVVLAAIILGTGSGSLCSNNLFSANILTFQRACIIIPLMICGLVLLINTAINFLITYPWILKALIIVMLLFFVGFFLGQLFPQGLKQAGKDSPEFVPWAWAVNGAASTIAAGIGVILSNSFGFNTIIICGAFCYALILVIPRFRSI